MGSKKGVSRGKYSLKIINKEKFTCCTCGKDYKRKPILLHHIYSKHLGYRAGCPVCGRQFVSISACSRHLKKVHSIKNHSKLKLKLEKPRKKTQTVSVTTNCLSYDGHKSFPYMAEVITFHESEQFGKHILAKRDLNVGNIVLTTSAFASIEYISSQSGCFGCGKDITINTFECKHCINLQFCSAKCSLSKIHLSKCKKMFHRNDCRVVRLVTEVIKIALETAENIQTFMDFSLGILFANKKSGDCLPKYSQYGEILQLKGHGKKEHLSIARRVLKIVVSLPQFKSLNTPEFQRTVFYLAYRHASTIEMNAFCEEFPCKKGILYLFSLYDVLSRFNHDCEPNVKAIIDEDNIINCVVDRSIKKDDQVSEEECQFKIHLKVILLSKFKKFIIYLISTSYS